MSWVDTLELDKKLSIIENNYDEFIKTVLKIAVKTSQWDVSRLERNIKRLVNQAIAARINPLFILAQMYVETRFNSAIFTYDAIKKNKYRGFGAMQLTSDTLYVMSKKGNLACDWGKVPTEAAYNFMADDENNIDAALTYYSILKQMMETSHAIELLGMYMLGPKGYSDRHINKKNEVKYLALEKEVMQFIDQFSDTKFSLREDEIATMGDGGYIYEPNTVLSYVESSVNELIKHITEVGAVESSIVCQVPYISDEALRKKLTNEWKDVSIIVTDNNVKVNNLPNFKENDTISYVLGKLIFGCMMRHFFSRKPTLLPPGCGVYMEAVVEKNGSMIRLSKTTAGVATVDTIQSLVMSIDNEKGKLFYHCPGSSKLMTPKTNRCEINDEWDKTPLKIGEESGYTGINILIASI